MNNAVIRWTPKPASGRVALAIGALLLALAASCSTVFRSSIQGTVIDSEDWVDGTTTGVTDAKVFLYTDEAARDADYAAYVDGDESSLPDGLAAQSYFQSTVTDANGAYDFTGFIWESLFPAYGKTADRDTVFLLIYHPDYGLWKNPVPLFVVSDVTNQLDQIKIEDLWNQGRFAGTVLDWKDDKVLNGVTVNIYVAKSWSYDGDTIIDPVYPTTVSATATTDADGRWSADVRFKKMPNRADDKCTAPVRVVYVLANYRANDDLPGDTGLTNTGLVTDVDLDRDGATAAAGDYEDAFAVATATWDKVEKASVLTTVGTVTMQRWSFSATVSGNVIETSAGNPGINGVTVNLTVGGEMYSTDSAPVDTAASTEDGRFDLGTVTWKIADIAVLADRKTGEVPVTMTISGITYSTVTGQITTLKPDTQRSITLKVTP